MRARLRAVQRFQGGLTISKSRRKKRKKRDYEGDLARVELILSRVELRMVRQALARAKKRDFSYVV